MRPVAMASEPEWDDTLKGYYRTLTSLSELDVSGENAMRLITVQNCVRMRASTFGRLPCHIMEQIGKERNKAEDFYLYEKLLHRPNFWMTAPEFWSMAEAHVSLNGQFLAYKLGLPGRPIIDLIPISPGAIQEITQKDDYSLDYAIRLKKTNEVRHLNQNQVFHLRGMSLDGITGLNPIEYARHAIGKGRASDTHLLNWFTKGLHPSAIVKHPASLNAPGHSNLKAVLKEKYQGLGKDYEFMLIDEGMSIDFPKISYVDAQFLEQMKLNEAQICGLFRVPQMLVASGDKAPTYASAEQFMLFYQMYSIDAPMYEAAIRRDLMTPEEQKRYYAKFEMKALQRGAFKDQMEGFQVGINCEILNPNEARDWLDMNPYEMGDEYRSRTSTVKNDQTRSSQGENP